MKEKRQHIVISDKLYSKIKKSVPKSVKLHEFIEENIIKPGFELYEQSKKTD